MTKQTIKEAIYCLAINFNKDIKDKDSFANLWYNYLKDEDELLFKKAIEDIICTETYFPTIAKIKEKMADMKLFRFPKAEDEWNKVISLVHKYGSYGEDKALAEMSLETRSIVEYIGYYRICTSTLEEQAYNKIEFLKEYNKVIEFNKKELMTGKNIEISADKVELIS